MKNLSLIILTFCCSITFAQLDSLGNLTYSANLNDVWGYKDELGNENLLRKLIIILKFWQKFVKIKLEANLYDLAMIR